MTTSSVMDISLFEVFLNGSRRVARACLVSILLS
jgi:hypothetical protein